MSAPELPAAVAINKDASRGNLLFVTLRLESGEAFPFLVDTGSMATVVDKSLEPRLGKRLEPGAVWNFGVKHKSGIYATPKLYLGSTLLRTSPSIWSTDFKKMPSPAGLHIIGILGMDCLRYYCIQLDFEAGQMRFLVPGQSDAAKWGKAFPVTLSAIGNSEREYVRPLVHCGSLIDGESTSLLIDTGYEADCALESGLFARDVIKHRLRKEGDAVTSQESRYVWFQKSIWNGATYTNLLIGNGGTAIATGNGENLIGLRFLARHLVTFDFPTRTMYLKQTSIGPLVDTKMEAATAFLNRLKQNNQLPGWSKNDTGTIYGRAQFNFESFDGRNNSDAFTYHYNVGYGSDDSSWRLQKAWRTDAHDHTVEQYLIP
jgi:hypothetical protein